MCVTVEESASNDISLLLCSVGAGNARPDETTKLTGGRILCVIFTLCEVSISPSCDLTSPFADVEFVAGSC